MVFKPAIDKDPIAREIQKYQEVLGRGTKLTGLEQVLHFVTAAGQSLEFTMLHYIAWGEFMNEHAISPKPTSNVEVGFCGSSLFICLGVNFNYDGGMFFVVLLLVKQNFT